VDGGSTDGTWEKLQELKSASPVELRLEQRRCNIAEGRNRAIELTDAPIIASTDAGSIPVPEWFAEITQPLLADEKVDVVGGRNISALENDFHRYLALFEVPAEDGTDTEIAPEDIYPSSRNTAFRREAWAATGGYPEWLTLTAEDALFTDELHKIGKVFFYNPRARVQWLVREDAGAYLKMLYRYGYGSGEARLHAGYFLRRLLLTVCPFLLLLSRHRFSHLSFRYRKNMMSAMGWLNGLLRGHRPPPGWKRIDGILLSPEAQKHLAL
jgi:cellulose synthase/poly-beta-1,6-N-acetylglucosamine synthase-like glycosyltransferase